MEDFNLILKSLISKDINKVHAELLSESMKKEFDKTADVYVANGNFSNAIKAYAITGNKEKLVDTSLKCLENNQPYDALLCFSFAEDVDNLNKVGFILLQIPDVDSALVAFKKSKNEEMTS